MNKLLRIRPLHYYWKYSPEQSSPWKIEARGKTFEPPSHRFWRPFGMAYKKRVYSPNRILYPLKRVDWDPDGERNPQNRGISKYERISWDRGLRHHRQGAKAHMGEIRQRSRARPVRRPRRNQDGAWRARHSCHVAGYAGRLYASGQKSGQLGGMVLGRQARMGHGAGRPAVAVQCQRFSRHPEEHRNLPVVGLRSGDYHLGLRLSTDQPGTATS